METSAETAAKNAPIVPDLPPPGGPNSSPRAIEPFASRGCRPLK
jgi:hypothetical protein